MLFRVFAKDQLINLYDILAVNHIVGPVSKGVDRHGAPLYDFDFIYDFAELQLDYTATIHSLKRFVLPPRETLCTFDLQTDSWQKHVDFNADKPIVYFGLHACDINALNKLDKVLLGNVFPDPYYAAKRKNMFIIGVGCMPQPFCFCKSMGTDSVLHGFDLFLTDLGDSYFVEIHSARAFTFMSSMECREPRHSEHQRFLEVTQERMNRFTCHVDTTDLTKILDLEFQADVWQEWGKKCLSCGTCANVCPTCYCYGIEENVDLSLQHATKTKHLYSCNLIDFAQVAGGHNFRPESHDRLKYRYYHKHRGFVEAFEESLCVGCGRCGQSCLANITVPEVIRSVRGEGGDHA
ncbi:MAG: 4Fe-4S dicluster domain-containing protein [Proteobacteria bacterium]|nr:4Fe-4S dicluster domain-containing protein [Pseudomonadota bacterium]MBU4295835.1 4Fe-4S dicluster domain-containing protein [Pseudomonadota bacterium]MCG2747859.1 4Fe-4S dicluster domain-containing protein [Desulfobulbaceae bacterium]